MTDPLLSATSLSKAYTEGTAAFSRRRVAALQDVSFDLAGGETLAITGESGSGKSTLAFIVARLEEASGGAIRLAGLDWLALRGRALRDARRNVQIVFQDPATSLNPRLSVGESVGEPLRVFRRLSGKALRSEVSSLLSSVGIDPSAAGRRPREFSGGERQRIAIARAIAPGPRVIVCDEPVAALDPSARARVLNLLLDLQASTGVAYLFISHDLDAIARMADRVAVLYAGRIVEEAPAADFFSSPRHPYSIGLLSGAISGEPPTSADEPSGCPFHPRCPEARPRCSTEEPGSDFAGGRRVACFFWRETAEKTKLSGVERVIR
jgi:peptide/nickel transport system ATP-binding protein/oligopeptide transport system ATP-binding protein